MQMARRDGWRSRAVYKLEQIADKERLLRPDMVCVDLGAAPGSWSQYVTKRLQGRVRLVALDLLPMDALPSVECIQGDFTEAAILKQVLQTLGDSRADLVMSDMAPNITGTKVVDQPRAMYLAELALGFAEKTLKLKAGFICKVFQGAGADEFIIAARQHFEKVKVIKPKASRAASREVYLVGRNFQG